MSEIDTIVKMKKVWKRFKKPSLWKKILSLVILASPVLLYIRQFGRLGISNDPQDWAVFGDYIGGVYTVLVTFFAIYLTRNLEKRDAEKNKARAAVGIIYEQIGKINYKHIDMRSVRKLLRLAKENELYMPQYLFDKLTELYDDYVVAKDEPSRFNIKKEQDVKSSLKKLYES